MTYTKNRETGNLEKYITATKTYGSVLCEESNNLKFIQDVLGHASADMRLNFHAQCQKK